MFLSTLKTWVPFQIDALGLVTLLGADQMNLTLGRLVYSRYTEYLPLLGAYMIANNDMTQPKPGFVVYNITDGIAATDVNGWFSRWLLCQRFTVSYTLLRICHKRRGMRDRRAHERIRAVGIALGVCAMGVVLIFPALMGDWWGVANAVSMLVSIFVRKFLLHQIREAITQAADLALKELKKCGLVKTFWTLPTGNVVSILLPRGILTDVILTNPHPPNNFPYTTARMLGWIAFACHVITLGMTILFNQIMTVAVLILSTILAAHRVGDDDSRIADNIKILREDAALGERNYRSTTYAQLRLSDSDIDSMLLWNLFPHRSTTDWWLWFKRVCDGHSDGFQCWDKLLGGQIDKSNDLES